MGNTFLLIGICVVLPIIVVFLNNRTSWNETNKKTEVLLKAIESGATIDPEYFKPHNNEKSIKEKLLSRLTAAAITSFIGLAVLIAGAIIWHMFKEHVSDFIVFSTCLGGITLGIGIALFVVYFIGKRMLAKEIKAEEDALKTEK